MSPPKQLYTSILKKSEKEFALLDDIYKMMQHWQCVDEIIHFVFQNLKLQT